MSTEPSSTGPVHPATLGEYVAALIGVLGTSQPGALARMRQVVGTRRARIVLDDAEVSVVFGPEGLHVEPGVHHARIDGEGGTNSATVLDLLDGDLEVTEAILSGRLRVSGDPGDVVRMFLAIEILLDASSRTPTLQALASRFRRDRDRRPASLPRTRHRAWYPFRCEASEYKMLARLDLLPDIPNMQGAQRNR